MNILKLNVAVFSSLIFLLFAVVDTAAGDDYVNGKLGKALTLGRNASSVKIPHYAGLKPDKAITISAWIKPERVGKGEWDWQEIYRKEDGNARALMAIGEYEKKHSLCFGLGISGKYVGHGVPLEPSKLLDGKWHLVSVTFDGKTIKFYADGQEIGASTKARGAIDTGGDAPAYIGSYKGTGEFFKGGIDDVRLYNRALSAGEIKTMAAAHLAQTAKPFTLAVLPDTQFYCDTRLKLSAKWGNGDLRRYFFAQTKWVRDNQKRLNIAFLVHEGDIVQADAPEEWAIAKKAMSILDGKVPYCMCLGNHDMGFEKADNKYGGNIGVNRTTHFNTYFPREKFAERAEFGGTFPPDRHDNSWYHFEAAGMKFLIVALECKPRDEVLAWANKVVAKHPDHRVIVLTHAYMTASKSRNTGGMKAKGNIGEQIWQKFVKKHKNIFMVLCGHHAGEAVLTSAGDHGNKVHQVLSDYQHLNNGGESWLRYMVFKPGTNKISIHTYNPALDKFKKGPSSRFDLDYPMALSPVTVPGITRPGAANDVNKEAVDGIVGWWKLDGDLKNSAADAPKNLLATLEGTHTPVMPKSLPSSWLTYHLAHPGPDNARPADPNCAIYYGGLYHLHYIYQNRGHTFAHVTSKDMVHWEWQPSVLARPKTGHGMYSGTAFLTREGKPAIIYHGEGSKRNQIAFAQDDKLNKWSNPFTVEPKTADGKPAEKMRHWDPDCWVMNDTYYALGGGQNPTLAKSKDLKNWEFLGELLHPDFPKDLGVPKGEDISCANMFKIGDKWMLLCISHKLGARYYLGDFKDEQFLPDHHAMMNWWGWDFFAPESLLTPDGRRVMWSWCTPPIKAWGQKGKVSDLASLMEGEKKIQRGIQSLPRELSLPEDGVLRIKPLRELEKLRTDPKQKRNITVKSDTEYLLKEMSGDTMELELVLDAPSARDFGIKVLCAKDGSGGFTISSGKASKVLNVGYIQPPFELKKGEDLTLRIFIDKSMIEVFANDRQAAVAWHEYDPKDISVNLFSKGGDTTVKSITSWKMNSIYTSKGVSRKSDSITNRPVSGKNVQSMFYKAQHQETGNMWDVWLHHHEGTYFLYYLANITNRWHWDNISMATSPDGVHWTERGPILKKTPGAKGMGTGSTWKSPAFEKDGKFYMNFSEQMPGEPQNIYFAESTDLLHWTRLKGEEYRFVQNEQWYKKTGRWDCIWTIPKPGGGLYGYWTASPDRSKKDAADGLFGFGESLDGVHWKALAPPKVIDDNNSGEVGAVEKIGDKYYMLFGHYPAMTTLVADRPEGPFRKAKKNYKVLTGHTYFSRFFRHPEGMLACHFTQARDVQVSFAPIKDVRIDQEGTLRFGWWKGNEKMKHRPIAVKKPLDSNAAVALLGNTFDTKQGLIIEGILRLPKTKDSPRSGVYVECTNNFGAGLLIDSSGVAELGLMNADGTDFKMEKRVDREMTFDSPAAFRLLVRGSLMEFYLDDILIESFALPANASGRIGLINSEGAIGTLKAWN